MPTTTNFGWTTPADTDLVKDGALAIRTLGNGVDTSLIDLKGGTTGQALTKQTNTDLDYQWTDIIPASNTFFAAKNKILNSNMAIWQRGTSFSLSATDTYTADRMRVGTGTGGAATVTREAFTPGSAPVAGYESQYYLNINQTTQGTSADDHFSQYIEDVRTFAGQSITVSVWGKVSTGTHNLTPQAVQRFGSGGSTAVATSGSTITLTTTWTRYSVTISVPSVSGKTIGDGSSLQIRFGAGTTGTKQFSYWGFQVEAGSTATAFQTATGNPQGELAACQRYYEKSYPQASAPGSVTNAGIVTSTVTSATNGGLWTFVPFKVTKRGTPTITIYGYNGGSGKVSSESTGNDQAANSGAAKVIGEYGFTAYNNSGGTVSPAGGTAFHYEASAEL